MISYPRLALSVSLMVAQIFAATQTLSSAAYAQTASPRSRPRAGVERYLRAHETLRLDAGDAADEVQINGRLRIAAQSKYFDLELRPHDLRASNYQAVDVAPGRRARRLGAGRVRTYKGIDLETGAEARFTVDEGLVEGVVITPEEKYFVEPRRKFEPSAGATEFLLYKSSDVYHDAATECSVPLAERAEEAFSGVSDQATSEYVIADQAAATSSFKEVEIATEADYDYVTALGGAAGANNEILSILNQVEGIYKAELGVSFKVTYQGTWSSADDPYTQDDSSKLLDEFRNYWNANRTGIARDIAHLWTGRDIYSADQQGNRNNNNVGVAFTGVVCRSASFAYGLTERRTDAGSKVRVTAHEIGHNFSASHALNRSECDNTIMSAVGGPSSVGTFCQFSRDEITAHLNANPICLSTVVNSSLQFSTSSYSVPESAGNAVITVTRTGDAAGAATVDYTTSDSAGLVNCATVTGTASSRCDYSTTFDTLSFAAGETSKTITVPIVDDAHVEGGETFNLTLANPSGATLGATSTANLTITDNDTSGSANPVDGSPFFVRVQYLDFLSREPEPAGFDAWVGVLGRCPNVNTDPSCDRITVSSSFFGSQEFQQKGYFVYRFYKVSFGQRPTYAEITADMRAVTGQTGDEVNRKKDTFTSGWVTRSSFVSAFPATLSPQAFVDKLEATAGVTLAGKAQLVADLQSGAKSRAQVVRTVVESAEVSARFYNEAFVFMQYVGYLRRDPEPGGFDAWLRVINANPADMRTMVNGFMNSTEYRARFGRP